MDVPGRGDGGHVPKASRYVARPHKTVLLARNPIFGVKKNRETPIHVRRMAFFGKNWRFPRGVVPEKFRKIGGKTAFQGVVRGILARGGVHDVPGVGRGATWTPGHRHRVYTNIFFFFSVQVPVLARVRHGRHRPGWQGVGKDETPV